MVMTVKPCSARSSRVAFKIATSACRLRGRPRLLIFGIGTVAIALKYTKRYGSSAIRRLGEMKRVRLGKSNLQVSQVAFGAWELGGDWGATDETAAIETIRHAADAGINFFDTAQG